MKSSSSFVYWQALGLHSFFKHYYKEIFYHNVVFQLSQEANRFDLTICKAVIRDRIGSGSSWVCGSGSRCQRRKSWGVLIFCRAGFFLWRFPRAWNHIMEGQKLFAPVFYVTENMCLDPIWINKWLISAQWWLSPYCRSFVYILLQMIKIKHKTLTCRPECHNNI